MDLQQLKDKFGYQGFTDNQWEWIKEKIDNSLADQKQRMVEILQNMYRGHDYGENEYNEAIAEVKRKLENL